MVAAQNERQSPNFDKTRYPHKVITQQTLVDYLFTRVGIARCRCHGVVFHPDTSRSWVQPCSLDQAFSVLQK